MPLGSIVGINHGSLANLTEDHHSQYALLAGRVGGQTLIGGTEEGDRLTLCSTSGEVKCGVALCEDDWFLIPTITGVSGAPEAGFGRLYAKDDGHIYWQDPAGISYDLVPVPATDHGSLSGLTDDDHPGYLWLNGRNGGQNAIGGTVSGDFLGLRSNSTGIKQGIRILPDDWLASPVITAPTTGFIPSNYGAWYPKSDGRPYFKNWQGQEFDLATPTAGSSSGAEYSFVNTGTNYIAGAFEHILVDLSSSNVAITLPTNLGDKEKVLVELKTAFTGRVVTISSAATLVGERDYKLYLVGDKIELQWHLADNTWRVVFSKVQLHRLRAVRASAQSIAEDNGVFALTDIVLDSVLHEYPVGMFNSVSGYIEIKRAGTYNIFCQASFFITPASLIRQGTGFSVNGIIARQVTTVRSETQDEEGVPCIAQVELAAGDIVRLGMRNSNSGTPLDTATAVRNRPELSVSEVY